MLGELILITGVTGHIGFAVLIHALKAGNNVRCAVRSQAKADVIRFHPRIYDLKLPRSRLTFSIVPDITVDGAYNDAMHNASAVIHIASPAPTANPIPYELHQSHFIQPAVYGTLNILRAAKRTSTVRRIIFTSSVVALVTLDQLEGRERRETPVRPDERNNHISSSSTSMFAAYARSKVAALWHAEVWMAAERPHFDAVYLHPSFVIGRNDIAKTCTDVMKGSNAIVLATVCGKKFGCSYLGAAVHINDVARIHVQALLPSIPGNSSYVLSTRVRWNDAKLIAKRNFIEAVECGIVSKSGSVGTVNLDFDASITENVFGMKLLSFEDQVMSALSQYIEMRKMRSAVSSPSSSSAGLTTGIGQHIQLDQPK
ncbi:NAD-dependent epimerase/dehydratase fum13 [Colletotrichum spaethianum]|uniref:NAD-dependent epimerase/dehydratase fum13 n=1 Tax=Colletotrichum spaethianum TaxID=700344 RepID=A0AA37USG4_9PEZI|nr:NAD-dependent epimerase/dehydratase fum13 [Colletotrichum spaethianum]GKT52487.1 NAD-dependent epimerase/dehydratase fum13 [Colletotrichum spaethianum]